MQKKKKIKKYGKIKYYLVLGFEKSRIWYTLDKLHENLTVLELFDRVVQLAFWCVLCSSFEFQ